MTTSTDAATSRRSQPPLWLVEGLDIAELRRGTLLAVTLGLCVVGVVLAFLAPGIVPPTPLVGAAVAFAAVLLGIAAAVAVDTADLTVRGPRHVSAAGGELVAVLPDDADPDAAAPLAEAVLEAREPDQPLLLGMAAVGRDARAAAAWTDALSVALARTGASVLAVDLASGRSPGPGLLEVVRAERTLVSTVSFAPGMRLARLGAGSEHGPALEALGHLQTRLPRDLDVLLVALPLAASRQVVAGARGLDHVLLVAERDRSSRIDLIAALDAMDTAGNHAQVALLDERTVQRLGGVPGSEHGPVTTGAVVAVGASNGDGAGDGAGGDDGVGGDDGAGGPAGETSDPAGDAGPAVAPDVGVAGAATAAAGVAAAMSGADDDEDGAAAADGVAEAELPDLEDVADASDVPDADASDVADASDASDASDAPDVAESRDPVGARDVEVVVGAAGAAALADLDPDGPTDPPTAPAPGGSGTAATEAPPAGQEPVATQTAAAEASGDDDGPVDPQDPVGEDGDPPVGDDPTDPVPRADPPPAGGGPTDDLRTTAQLAILVEDLDARDEPSGP